MRNYEVVINGSYRGFGSRRLTYTAGLIAAGMAAAVLMAMPGGGPESFLGLEETVQPSAGQFPEAQAELWNWERNKGIPHLEAYTATANASIAALKQRKVAPPGDILRIKAIQSEQKEFQAEAKRGIHDPDAAAHTPNILDINAKKSAEAYSKWQKLKSNDLDEDEWDHSGRGSITKYLQAATDAEKAAVQVTERPFPSVVDREHERYLKKEAEQKAAEKVLLAKEEAARQQAAVAAKKEFEAKIAEAKAATMKEDERKAAAQRNYEKIHDEPASVAPSKVVQNDKRNSIVSGVAPVTAAAHSSQDDDKGVTVVTGESTSDSTKAEAAKPKPGMLCLSEGGLSDQQLKDFSDSTVCVGWEIKRNMGLGDTVHMIQDYLDAPMNRKKIMHCVKKLNPQARKVIKTCLGQLPAAQRVNNPVVTFWDSAVD